MIRLLLLFFCYFFLLGGIIARDEKISFLTYNLFHIHAKDYNPFIDFPVAKASRRERTPLQAQELKKTGATFILLQESFEGYSRVKLVKIMQPEYGVINNESYNIQSGLFQFGSGLLILYKKSQVKFIEGSAEFETFPFKYSVTSEKLLSWKGVLYADFQSNQGLRINVMNAHLASLDHTGAIRTGQVKWMKELVKKRNLSGEIDLQIIGGDFNTHKYKKDGSLQGPIKYMGDKSAGGFALTGVFANYPHLEKPTWDNSNLLVELSKWPLYSNEILDYLFTYSATKRCSAPKNPRLALQKKFPLPTLTGLANERKKKREKALATIRSASPGALKNISQFRKRSGTHGWKWLSKAKKYDASGKLREAIDDLFGLTSLEGKDITRPESLRFTFEKAGDAYLAPLSDHFAVMAEVSCM